MKFSAWIQNLQNRPTETKQKILIGSTLVIGLVLVAVWSISLKGQIKGLDISDSDLGQTNKETAIKYVTMERVEFAEGSAKFFFTVKNETTDILNFSKLNQIELTADGQKMTALKITDRQNKPFVQKILSRQEVFGILTFSLKQGSTGRLEFDDLYFEQHPEIIFKETIDIDFKKLNPPQNLRE